MSRFLVQSLPFLAAVVTASLFCLTPSLSVAGMPSPLLDDVSTVLRFRDEPVQRLQVMSFFLTALLLSAVAVKWLWNGLQQEFTKLPRLTFGKSLLMTIAWGILFCIVLVMISGARELMTPGAWEKTGATYELVDRQQPDSEDHAP